MTYQIQVVVNFREEERENEIADRFTRSSNWMLKSRWLTKQNKKFYVSITMEVILKRKLSIKMAPHPEGFKDEFFKT